jgi:hypothetical protein
MNSSTLDRSHRASQVVARLDAAAYLSYNTYDMTNRINARLDPELAAKVEEIRRQTGMTITEIVEAALVAWTTQGLASRSGPSRAFAAAGFIGSGSGPRHLARDAKRVLRQTLRNKT